ncbi:cytochrome P450 [Actinomadura fulvescens]|uniref:Cytochrome P450 n=1 Tax=Actinomadura fulvescens TaxID=46160 RepID=A0ABN3QTT0_9ACTN
MRVDLTDPSRFADGTFWSDLAWLRENDPVHWHADAEGGFWAVTRHSDVLSVYARHETFVSGQGMRLGDQPDAVGAVAQRMLIVSDPPDHTHLKRVLGKSFRSAEMPRLDRLVRQTVGAALDTALAAGEIDLVPLAGEIPNSVICSLMGLPPADWRWIGGVTTAAFEGPSEDARSAAHSEIFLYFSDLVAERRKRPGDDYISRITHDLRDTAVPCRQRPLTEEEVVYNCHGVLAGANETTRYAAAGGTLALAERPDQWRLLVDGGAEVAGSATEEVLRWTTPAVHVLRTATRPADIGGVPIADGARVTLWNVSANRDADVFPDPDRFDVTRSPNRHVAFGGGRHRCIGARLARHELEVYLTELAARVARIELTGAPRCNASNFTLGLTSLPVRLTPR